MSDIVVFVANGFSKENMRLQPWRYVYELAKHKSKSSDVIVITEGNTDSSEIVLGVRLKIIETRFLCVTKQSELCDLLLSLAPSELWWSTTQRSIAYYSLLSRIHCRKFAFITCPIYKWSELVRATMSGVPFEQTKALWSQRMVPRLIFKTFLNGKIFEKIVVQSHNNKKILQKAGVNGDKLHLLPVGIDEDDIKPVDQETIKLISSSLNRKDGEFIFLYLGSLKPIRGFDSLIKSFPDVVRKNGNARLIVLARGASQEQCDQLLDGLNGTGAENNISIEAGWLTREQVWAYIELSDMVVLPFVLVPSDIPIAVLESLARNKPVIVSPVDGLPELAKGRGGITDPLNTRSFSEELHRISQDKAQLEQYANAAHAFIENYPRWSDVGQIMDKICINDKQSVA